MKRLMKKLEDMMVAVTFAEAGEYDTANEIMNGKAVLLKDAEGGEDENVQTVEAA
jgi:hypothetical protein